jgi:hypothetical protein
LRCRKGVYGLVYEFFGLKRSKTAEIGGSPGLESTIPPSKIAHVASCFLENLGPFIALAPMRLRHTCKVATNSAKPTMGGCVCCSRGSPHRRFSSVFCVSRSKKGFFGSTVVSGIRLIKIILKSPAGLTEKFRVLLPKNTLERCVACVILRTIEQ